MKQLVFKETEKKLKDYYENNKEVLREKAKDTYRGLSEEEKKIKREYEWYRYTICLRKGTKTERVSKKLSWR